MSTVLVNFDEEYRLLEESRVGNVPGRSSDVGSAAVYRRRWQILAVLCLSLILMGLDTLILNLALPTIQQDLAAGTSQLQWMIDAYALAFGGLLLMAGGLADRFGRKRLLTLGVGAFAVFWLFKLNGATS